MCGCESLPRTTKAKLASPLRANHWRRYWTPKDPEARLAVELGLRVRTLHDRDPSLHARAPRQEGVQSGCRRRRYQLDGDKLACANSAEAARRELSPRFHVSQVDCVSPNGRGNRRFRNLLRMFLKFFKRNGPQEITCENKILLYCRLRTQWGTCPIRVVPRNNSEGIIPLRELVRLSNGSQLDT